MFFKWYQPDLHKCNAHPSIPPTLIVLHNTTSQYTPARTTFGIGKIALARSAALDFGLQQAVGQFHHFVAVGKHVVPRVATIQKLVHLGVHNAQETVSRKKRFCWCILKHFKHKFFNTLLLFLNIELVFLHLSSKPIQPYMLKSSKNQLNCSKKSLKTIKKTAKQTTMFSAIQNHCKHYVGDGRNRSKSSGRTIGPFWSHTGPAHAAGFDAKSAPPISALPASQTALRFVGSVV